MNGFILTLGLGLLAVLLPAVGVAWWEHRKRSAEVQTRRRELDAPVRKTRSPEERGPARPASAMDAHPDAHKAPAAGNGSTTSTAAMAAAALPAPPSDAPAQAPVAEPADTAREPSPRERFDGPGWAETAPMTGMGTEPSFAETMPAELHHFAETLPAELELKEPPARPGKRRQPA